MVCIQSKEDLLIAPRASDYVQEDPDPSFPLSEVIANYSIFCSTHTTMVRLYTTELQCQVCFRPSSLGFLYRCTEDRELVMEADFENGTLVSARQSEILLHELFADLFKRRRWMCFAICLNL